MKRSLIQWRRCVPIEQWQVGCESDQGLHPPRSCHTTSRASTSDHPRWPCVGQGGFGSKKKYLGWIPCIVRPKRRGMFSVVAVVADEVRGRGVAEGRVMGTLFGWPLVASFRVTSKWGISKKKRPLGWCLFPVSSSYRCLSKMTDF